MSTTSEEHGWTADASLFGARHVLPPDGGVRAAVRAAAA